MKLPKEMIESIEKEAMEVLAQQQFHYPADNWSTTEVAEREYEYGYQDGATTWAEKWWELKQDLDTKIDEALHEDRNKMQVKLSEQSKTALKLRLENEKLRAALEEMNESAQRLFDVRKQKNKGNIVLNAWNDLAGMLYKSKRLLKALAEKVKEGEE